MKFSHLIVRPNGARQLHTEEDQEAAQILNTQTHTHCNTRPVSAGFSSDTWPHPLRWLRPDAGARSATVQTPVFTFIKVIRLLPSPD